MELLRVRSRWLVLLPLALFVAICFGTDGVRGAGDEALEPVEAGEPKVDKPLLAHWTFNERGPTATVHEASGKTALGVTADRSVPRTRGVHGNALDLSGTHRMPAAIGPELEGLANVTFSGWTRPTDLSGYREIFRQECPERLLFSFQNNGTVLSLGLNVDGYEECDARIDPAQVLDGAWHHCAGVFDGRTVRVYLDGKEIGSMERPGALTTGSVAPAFIGSSNGSGEYFQGALDDLRVYKEALSPEEIASLYRGGLDSIARLADELEKELAGFYSPGGSFAETLANSRKRFAEQGGELDRDLAAVLLTKLKAQFPEDYENFLRWTGANPIRYLTAEDVDFLMSEASRLVELLVEYKPLTETQWKKQTPEQLRKWKEAEKIQERFEKLAALGAAARFSPEWIDVLFAAAEGIDFRPSVSEAVAPYVKPQTPPVVNLTAAEARETLERDWLHQADGKPTPERIRSEIAWTRELAERIGRDAGFSKKGADLSAELTALAELEKQAAAVSEPDQKLYFRVREVKRRIMFRNPAVDFGKVLFVDMPFPQGKEWPHQTRHRLGYMAVPGARLLILDGLSPEGKLAQLAPQPPFHGSFWRPDLSYDATKVLFCFKPHNEKSFHLYEVNVDGTGLRQLTDGPYDDLDPIYLPDDEHVLFSTTRGHTYVRCMPPTNAYVLARCDRNGKNVYLISHNNEPDYLPSVMNDGRVIYTRWEYTDKPLWRAQALWTVNPDGTQVSTYWGNQSVWPDLLKDARSIPGSRRVMFTGSAHHNWFSGSVGIIDPDRGYNFPYGVTKITADVEWPESGNGPVDPVESPRYHPSGQYAAYYSPYPLSERDFLVSANRGGKFVLYLMDVDGNRELVYEGTNNIFHALPLVPRRKPPVIADRVAWPERKDRLNPAAGVVYSNNVYFGAPQELRGKAKYLRVLSIEPKTYTYWHKRPYISTGPVVSIVQSEGVKRIFGTVPLEEDGSVAFSAPPNEAIHFQLLDKDYRTLQTMRSFTGVMPGERRGCLGCHELHSTTPQRGPGKGDAALLPERPEGCFAQKSCVPFSPSPIALSKPPQPITPPPWGQDTVSYERYVQPVLDKYCGKCHQGDGEGRKKLDLTFRPGFLMFNEPYVTLTGKPSWGRPYDQPKDPPPGWGIAGTLMVESYDQRDPNGYRTPPPMTSLSYKSKLIEIASSGEHNDVKVDPVSLRRLIAWVDTMCPYRGAEEVRAIPDPEFQGIDWLAIRPKIQTAPTIIRPGPLD
ncbi:MAG TPA: LamG-like jellyroll fold domain-containing protein [Thermoguttaceae bacterium]|nr:LamG-like jellyroll fold domain-containing protein [Thermoguttaceae bacterium]